MACYLNKKRYSDLPSAVWKANEENESELLFLMLKWIEYF